MTTIYALDPARGSQAELDFAAFLDVAKGSTIRSAAVGDDFLELGLTDQVNVRFQVGAAGDLAVLLFSTLNADDIPPLRLQIIDDEEVASAALIEARIRALRQAYAMSFLVQNDRIKDLEDILRRDPTADLEIELLPEADRLYIVAAAPGSFWLTVATKSVKAYKAAKYALALPYKEGREAILARIKADTRLKELSVEEKRLDIDLKRANGVVDTLAKIDKLKDPVSRDLVRSALITRLDELGSPGVPALPSPSSKAEEDEDESSA